MSVKGIGLAAGRQWRLLCGVAGVCGLCTAALANTTAPPQLPPASQMSRDLPARQTGVTEPSDGRAIGLPPATRSTPAYPQTPVTKLSVAPIANSGAMPGRVRMALLLPMRSPALRGAAEMVRDGFRVAQQRDGANVELTIIETDDNPQNIAALYREAVIRHDVLVGPLTRSGAAAVAAGGNVSRPTIALGQPDAVGDVDLQLPPKMLVIGLSIEEEARQVADWATRLQPGASALVLSTGVAWQRRAARAFGQQWQRGATPAETMELYSGAGGLDPGSLSSLKKRLERAPPDLIFVALDAAQARQLRRAIGKQIPLYGTSQINALNLSEASGAELRPELDGVRLLDLPWQLQVDHPAVMIYPRPFARREQRRGPDFERLYALGIDAFRVASEIGAGHLAFTLDGVTGKLSVQFDGTRPAVFVRTEQQAAYADGALAAVPDER